MSDRIRRATARRTMLLAVIALFLFLPRPVVAMCDVIPGVTQKIRGALGTVNRPFAIPGDDGQGISIELDPSGCAAPSGGLVNVGGGSREDDYFVTVVFKPPGSGLRNAVVLTTSSNLVLCQSAVASATAMLGGGTGTCRTVEPGTEELIIPDDQSVRFRFPDTDANLAPNGDDRTFAGPASIAITAVTDALPFELSTTRCADRPGLVACIDELYADDGTCLTNANHLGPVFSHFTALPPANDYQAVCSTPGTECTGLASELRFAVDVEGNVLIPMDWRGILLRPNGIPVPRLVQGSSTFEAFAGGGTGIEIPGESYLAAYSTEGHRLPPLFEPISDPSSPNDLGLLGSVDAPVGVTRLARRVADLSGVSPVYRQCTGGAKDGMPCLLSSECPSGTCGQATCHLDQVDTGNPCTQDAQCGVGEECGPALFDFSDRLESGVGPIVIPDTEFDADAVSPVPLEGLLESENLLVTVELESIRGSSPSGPVPVDLNGDGDTTDAVLVLRDRSTGVLQSTGVASSTGRATTRINQAPFSSSAAAIEGDIVAFLESEPRQFTADANGDGDVFDSILRVFRRNSACIAGSACSAVEILAASDLAADAAPLVNAQSLVVSNGLVFFRRQEAASAPLVTVDYGINAGGDHDMSNDGSQVVAEFFGAVDRDTDADGVFDEPGATSTVLGVYEAISATGRFLVLDTLVGLDVVDRDTDEDGIFDEPGETSVSSLTLPGPGRPDISGDGRYIAFNTDDGLPAGETDVVVYDRDADENGVFDEAGAGATATVLINVTPFGGRASGSSSLPAMSRDGRVVAFRSDSTSLVIGDVNGLDDIFVHDRDADGNGVFDEPGGTTTELATVSSDGSQQNFDAGLLSISLAISEDGRYTVYSTAAENLVAGDTNGELDAFVYDRETRTTRRYGLDPSGNQFIGGLGVPLAEIGPDGRYATFTRFGTPDEGWRVDLLTGFSERLDTGVSTFNPIASEGGRHFAFTDTDGLPNTLSVFGVDTTDASSDFSGNGRVEDTVLQVLDTALETVSTVCPADQVVVSGDRAAFLRPEASGAATGCPAGGGTDPADLNGDGDRLDAVVHFYEHGSAVQNLGVAANDLAISGSHLAALVPTATPAVSEIQVADLAVPPVLAAIGSTADSLALVGSVVAFTTPEDLSDLNGDLDADDRVIHFHDASTMTTTSIGQAVEDFVLSDSALAFRTSEAAQGGTDLNLDGDSLDDVLQVYDLVTGQLFNTSQAVIPCRLEACDPRVPYRVSGDIVTFLTLEADQGGLDLDGNGSTNDLVLQTFNVREAADASLAAAGESLAAMGAGICTDTAEACVEDAACSAGSCFLPPGGCIEDLGTFCNPSFPLCGPGEYCAPILGLPGSGTCKIDRGPCASDDDCSAPAICEDGESDLVRLFAPLQSRGDGTQVFLSAGLQESITGNPCNEAADCIVGEICNAAGFCQADRDDLIVVGAADSDADGVADPFDNCPLRANGDQIDEDLDGIGSACDLTPTPEPSLVLLLAAGGSLLVALGRRRVGEASR